MRRASRELRFMARRRNRFAVVLFVMLPASSAVAQSVTVSPDRTSLGTGETLRLRIVMKGRFDEVRGPDIPDFDVVGKSSGTSISVIGGVIQQEQQVDLTLLPRRAGRLLIGPVELLVGGRVVAASQPLTIVVGGGGPSPPPGPPQAQGPPAATPPEEAPLAPAPPGPPERFAGQQAFLWVRVPDRVLYVGEPIYVEYVLFVNSRLPVQAVRAESMPDFKGFVVTQAPTDDRAQRVRLRGVWYDTYVQWRGALTVLEPGKATLGSMSVILVVGDLFSQRRYRVSSDPVVLEFQDLPTEGRPADYVPGVVGSFVIRSSLDKDRIRVGESALLTVTVSGSGNLRAVNPPAFQVSEGLRISQVPSSDLDERVVDVGGESGRRFFQYLLTGEREGEYEVPRLDIVFFNPMTGRYERSRSDPLRVQVAGYASGGPIREVQAPDVRIVEVIANVDLSARPDRRESSPLSSKVIGGFLSGPFLVFLGVEAAIRLRDRRQKNSASIRRRRALADAVKALRRLSIGLPSEAFWAGLDQVMREYLRARFGVSADLPQEEVRAGLLERGAPADAVDALIAELDACAFGRFAPSAAQERDRVTSLERVRGCLMALDRAREGRG